MLRKKQGFTLNVGIVKHLFYFVLFQHMQLERRSFGFYNTTVSKVFQMFPHGPYFTESSPDRCVTCAVVGNSGNLNGSLYGPLIDFHDIVIRYNETSSLVKWYALDHEQFLPFSILFSSHHSGTSRSESHLSIGCFYRTVQALLDVFGKL